MSGFPGQWQRAGIRQGPESTVAQDQARIWIRPGSGSGPDLDQAVAWTRPLIASRYPWTPKPMMIPLATGEMKEWCRNCSR